MERFLFSCIIVSLAVLGLSECANDVPVVHVIPHSHCDAGYRESFDEYWKFSVHFIIDSVLEALSRDQSKRFVWEEVSFLSTWWKQASNESRNLMKKLHATGQLEFIGGGWVMHDEADPSLFGILNQMHLGLKFLRDTLGARPTVEWHIDPFGHSVFMPELYSQLGYKAVVINRVPNAVKQSMRAEKGLEFYWKYPSSNLSIFTHVLDSHYGTPKLHGEDTKTLVEELVPILKKRLQWFKTDQLLLPFGGDFNFKLATVQFSQMDGIIKYINANVSGYNLKMRYSTLSEYFSAAMSTASTYETRSNDFYPYLACYPCGAPECDNAPCGPLNQSNDYWSGFYTSKPAQKLLVRQHEARLKSLEVLSAFHPCTSEVMTESLELGRNTSALLQHHDAITGTSYSPAFDDYNVRLNNAMEVNDGSIASLKSSILCEKPGLSISSDSMAVLKNLYANKTAAVLIHNPLPVQRSTYITVQLPDGLCTQVFTSNQTSIPSQQVSSLLYFPMTLPAWGMEVVFLARKECDKRNSERSRTGSYGVGFSLSNGILSLKFDENSHIVGHGAHSLYQAYLRFDESVSITPSVTDGANVYTFDPSAASQKPTVLTPKGIPTSVTANGPLVWEVKQQINDFINATVRLYFPINNRSDVQHSSFAEWQTIVGPLPKSPAMSITSKFSSTDVDPEDFVTYTNGFYPVTRQYNTSATVQANTYPMVGRAFSGSIRTTSSNGKADDDVLAVIIKRPMAVTGRNGSLEMMLHRRLVKMFDKRGDDSTIMDDSVLIGFLVRGEAPAISSRMMSLFQAPPTVHFALLNGTHNNSKEVWSKVCGDKYQWMPSSNSLPQGVEIVNLKLLTAPTNSANSHQVGLHIIYTNESAPGPCTVEITGFFREYTVTAVVEATPDFLPHADSPGILRERRFVIELYPLQLKTFIITLQ